MNTKKRFFAITVVLAFLNATPVKTNAQVFTGFSARIDWHITPNPNGPIYPLYRDEMMRGLRTGTAVGRYVPLPNQSVVHPQDITLTPYNLAGFQPEAGLVIRSQTKFRLWDVLYEFSSSDTTTEKPLGTLGFSGNFSTNNYSITRIGWDFGPDGTLNTSDDIFYTSGSGSIPVNALDYRGVSKWFEERTTANVGDVDRYVAGKQPYTISARYTVVGLDSVQSTIRVQPITVTPAQPVQPTSLMVILGASPSTIANGASFLLSYSVSPSPSATTITILPDVGVVGEASGTRTLTPKVTTRYTITASGPGVITGTTSIDVVVIQPTPPPPPPKFAFVVSASVPTGNILPGKLLTLSGTVANNETGSYVGTLTNVWRYSVNGGQWVTLASGGTLTNLVAGESKTVLPFVWEAGKADPGTAYRFQLLVQAADGEHVSEETLRVVPPLPPITLRIRNDGSRPGERTTVIISGPAGTYEVRQSDNLLAPWESRVLITTMTKNEQDSPVLTILPTRGNAFFSVKRTN